MNGTGRSVLAGAAGGARPFELSEATHPHLRLTTTMISVPQVHPGDMVFWHCDTIHAVEKEHAGAGDSSVMYIPAMSYAEQNWNYVQKQLKKFEQGFPPPDFPQGRAEHDYISIGKPTDIIGAVARTGMGLTA